MEEESDEEKLECGERISEDRETIPRGIQNVEESSSEEREEDESSGAMREQANGEEESDSDGNQENNDMEESSPREVDKSHISSSPDGSQIAEISEDEPLVNSLTFATIFF